MSPVIKKEKTPAEALASLMRLCSRAEKSSGDARRLMRGWGIAPAEAEEVLAELVDRRFIDDARYAAAYTREKLRASGWGAYKIRAALAAKGVARDIVNAALEEHLDPGAQTDRLEKQLARRRDRLKAATPYELRMKLTRYALSLGYEYETVTEAVEKTLKK
jgi:regulatory protein